MMEDEEEEEEAEGWSVCGVTGGIPFGTILYEANGKIKRLATAVVLFCQ